MEIPSDNLYVSNLPPAITEGGLSALFSSYGVVTQCKCLPNPMTGSVGASGMGVALVRFRSIEEATLVMTQVGGSTPEGFDQPISIKYAANNPRRDGRGMTGDMGPNGPYGMQSLTAFGGMESLALVAAGVAGAAGGTTSGALPEPAPHEHLYFKGLPMNLDEVAFMAVLGNMAKVTSVKILPNPNPKPGGDTFGAAMATFDTVDDALHVKHTLNGQTPDWCGQKLLVRFANQRGGPYGSIPVTDNQAALLAAQLLQASAGAAGAGYGTGHGTPPEPAAHENLYFKGLPANIDELTLREVLGSISNLVSVKVLSNPKPGTDGCGTAMARFASLEDAAHVKDMLNGQTPDWCGQRLLVRFATQKGGPGNPNMYAAAQAQAQALALAQAQVQVEAAAQAQAAFENEATWAAEQAAWAAGVGIGAEQAAWIAGSGGGAGADVGSAISQLMSGNPIGRVNADFLVTMVHEAVVVPGAGAKINNADSTIYVSGLPGDMTERHAYKLFSPLGAIFSVSLKHGGVGESSWAICFVNFVDPLSAQAAIAVYNGMQVPEGNVLKVSIKQQIGSPLAVGNGPMLALVPPGDPDCAPPPPPTPAPGMALLMA